MTTYTTAQVAEMLGITDATVRQVAARKGIGRKHGRDWVFTQADLQALRGRRPGRPATRPAGDTPRR